MGKYTGITQLWPLEDVPDGFLALDGSEVSQTTYAELYALYGDDYGTAVTPGYFKLPDTRGLFPRCCGASTVDPDAASRTDRGDGTTGNVVGTKQADAMVEHGHNVRVGNAGVGGMFYGFATATPRVAHTELTGASDSRPKNIYLQLIVRI